MGTFLKNPVVLVKKLPVWFFHLSGKYRKPIKSLTDIPNEEIEQLKSLGIDYLWLIGLWQRSFASEKIKRLQGEKDKIGSAYSIVSYDVDNRVGDKKALDVFLDRLHSKGMGLVVDIIPNHMSVDSKWLIENPDFFMQAKNKPYDNYCFSGVDLCDNEKIEVRIEDKYYTKEDAAVVFSVKNSKGQEWFIYHGNNGEGIPWNDTAQLDYTNQVLRKKMLLLIRDMSKKYDGIRFDAAMLLLRNQYRRLWFPEPGKTASVPSRDSYSLEESKFLKLMPEEFWDEAGRVLKKKGLYIFEVFWGLEKEFLKRFSYGYVYNAAFAHHLALEENAELKNYIKDILSEELRLFFRFLYYLSSPDQDSPLSRYKPMEKYKGACCFMSALPGAFLFTHGQIEGYQEYYPVDVASPSKYEEELLFLWHHEVIAPILHEKKNMGFPELILFFPFFVGDSEDDDVFVFFVKTKTKKYLIAYNNSSQEKKGYFSNSFASRCGERIIKENIVRLITSNFAYELIRKERLVFKKAENCLFLELGPYQPVFFIFD
ncbi:alpha-amylase family glycosyl hydrolase [Spirochaetia bacterium 38H-sp]|uniref:Alpha-amylase family glycosyl hydrolase n=1 Tax=Rarispira pelagica TaxID=3141764 RepID=A0ABU9U962_9SPIR